MGLLKIYVIWFLLFVISSCANEINYESIVSEVENVDLFINSHLINRGKDENDNYVFYCYYKKTDSTAFLMNIRYLPFETFVLLDQHNSISVYDSLKLKKNLELIVKLKIKSIAVDSLGQIRIDLNEEKKNDLVRLTDKKLIKLYKNLKYRNITDNWYIRSR